MRSLGIGPEITEIHQRAVDHIGDASDLLAAFPGLRHLRLAGLPVLGALDFPELETLELVCDLPDRLATLSAPRLTSLALHLGYPPLPSWLADPAEILAILFSGRALPALRHLRLQECPAAVLETLLHSPLIGRLQSLAVVVEPSSLDPDDDGELSYQTNDQANGQANGAVGRAEVLTGLLLAAREPLAGLRSLDLTGNELHSAHAAQLRQLPVELTLGPHEQLEFSCTFCGKSRQQVRKLLSGPQRVFMCDECVSIASDIIGELADNRP